MEITSAQRQAHIHIVDQVYNGEAAVPGLPLEEVLISAYSKATVDEPQQQQKELERMRITRPQPEHALKCPRCESTNTKFCYYNNYSLSQPRYFCKGCRRYWTKGGSLRNIPVGGGCRKNKRPNSSSSSLSSSSSSSSSSLIMVTRKLQEQQHSLSTNSDSPPAAGFLQPYYQTEPTLANFARLHDDHLMLDHDHKLFLLGNPNPSHLPPDSTGIPENNRIANGFNHNYGGDTNSSATTTTATTVTTNFRGSCKAMDGGDGMGLMDLRLQGSSISNYADMAIDPALDRGQYCWNGVDSAWHGLVNSSLI